MTLHYRAEGREFLDRRRRATEIMDRIVGGKTFDGREVARDWSALMREIPEIPFEEGRRYRLRVVAGAAEVKHAHLEELVGEEAGRVIGVDLPMAIEGTVEFRELEVVFVGRVARLPTGGSSTLWLLDDGETALLGDVDVLEADEVAS